ncbi:2Fe-2S iron-sulfur cluster-binding protein [Leptospira ellisii]|uniref:2Fe-2S iron-sulfur cluster-binding protein n=1 Tax=Leptospira ellisii TaxID=2023197 RepID=A0A2N0BNK6_9LEPT|nr:2Fe-2S iron-sulfur cluster-binding protein [Leptospira ellisii]MDV6235993.1 2Fe-2S iron-sulfur cluster-binding protein [Leptospira ellisii]PJZ94269.1 hypothetical protein CH379_03485 [Leptospira ellisii]PKA05559.1 hypothetical protein CH375_04490 [Leptospira ellisii]
MNFRINLPDPKSRRQPQETETVLEVALRTGIELPYSCRFGRCGVCKILLVEGEVEFLSYNRFALTDEEKRNGYILACRSVPKSDLVVRTIETGSN